MLDNHEYQQSITQSISKQAILIHLMWKWVYKCPYKRDVIAYYTNYGEIGESSTKLPFMYYVVYHIVYCGLSCSIGAYKDQRAGARRTQHKYQGSEHQFGNLLNRQLPSITILKLLITSNLIYILNSNYTMTTTTLTKHFTNMKRPATIFLLDKTPTFPPIHSDHGCITRSSSWELPRHFSITLQLQSWYR